MDPEIHFQVQLDDAVFGKSWNDIPDLDAGRIPFPISMRGRYAIGERKTAVVVFLGFAPLGDEQRMLDSLLSSSQFERESSVC